MVKFQLNLTNYLEYYVFALLKYIYMLHCGKICIVLNNQDDGINFNIRWTLQLVEIFFLQMRSWKCYSSYYQERTKKRLLIDWKGM